MPLPLRGRELSGKFQFVRRLGKGGMASVWLALNTAVDREVAIKVIRPEVLKNEDLVARFRSEAKAAGRIGHPNVCEILDFGLGPIGPYIVMESLRGKNLAELIRERGQLPAEEAVQIVLEALRGLEAAHDRGIVHRDLKPENVFLHEPVNGPQEIKLMDFGVAKFTDGSAEITTEHGALLGTPEYMAPEQFKGADLAEARTDIWAVGAILYRALAGRHAFKGPTVAATLLMVTNDDPTPLRELAPDVPEALVDVIARCLSKEIDERYASVGELRTALEASLVYEGASAASLPVLEDLDDEPLDSQAPGPEDSAIERRPTESFPASAPETTSGRTWLVLAAMAVLGTVAAFALWPDDPPTEPKTAAEVTPAGSGDEQPPHSPAKPSKRASPTKPTPIDGLPPPPEEPIDPPEPEEPPEEVIEVMEEPDVGSAKSSDVPPAPAPDAFEEPTPAPPKPSAEPVAEDLPAGVIDIGGGYVMAERRNKRTDHGDARKFCEALGVTRHLGFKGWKLPFPGAVKRIKDSGKAPRGTYWTSARWRGNVTVFVLPSGDMRKGVNAKRRSARTLCIADLSSRS